MVKLSIPSAGGATGGLSGPVGVLLAVALTAALTGLLYARVALSGATVQKEPLTVAVQQYRLQDSYQREASYLGLVVAGQRSDLGFEIPGQLAVAPPRQGTPVQRGELLASLDRTALDARRRATAADLATVRAELELARLKARRQQELVASGAVSAEAYDETRLREQALVANAEAVAARLEGIDIELQQSRLIAPYDGLIAERYVQQGAVVSPGTPVVRLLGSGALEAHVGVGASRAGALQPGANYTLRLRQQRLQAALLSVRPDVDPVTRAVTAVFALPAGTTALDGEPLTLLLPEDVPQAGGWLPVAALLEGERGTWTVLRVVADGDTRRTVREVVEVLDTQDDRAFVRGSLADGALVVAGGVHRITPGAAVTTSGAD